jgi:hypothetical protein
MKRLIVSRELLELSDTIEVKEYQPGKVGYNGKFDVAETRVQ